MSNFERLFENSAGLVSCCSVEPGQANSLTPDEMASMQNCVDVVRDRSAAARLAAQDLFASAGIENWQLPRIIGNAPAWPAGWTGSLSHSDHYAAAALADRRVISGIGVDLEPAKPLPLDVRDTVILAEDIVEGVDDTSNIAGRIVFCAKEATYKAVYPIDGRFLDFHEVTVDLDSGIATTCYGRRAKLSVHIDHRIVVLAEVSASG